MKRTVLEMLSYAATNYQDLKYVTDKTDEGWFSMTFSQVEQATTFLATALINEGIIKDDKIAILSEGRSSWIISEYAILKAQAICVPLSVKLRPLEILFRVEHSDSKYIIVSKNCVSNLLEIKQQLSCLNIKIIFFDQCKSIENDFPNIIYYNDLLKKGEELYPSLKNELQKRIKNVEESDTATISYTSGTCGNPKGIMLSHLNYWSNSHDAVQYFRLENHLKLLLILPLDHAFAHTIGFYCAALCGMQLFFVDSRDGLKSQIKKIPENIQETSPDFLLVVPAFVNFFIKKIKESISNEGILTVWLFNQGIKNGIKYFGDGFKKPSIIKKIFHYPIYALADKIIFSKIRTSISENLKFFISGGARLDIKQQEFFNCIGIPVLQGYGQTEASPIISVNQRFRHKFGSSGGILSGIDCKIIDENTNQELPNGQKGLIYVKGLSVMKGYYKNEKATLQKIDKDKRLNTGDIGYIDKDGFLFVTGRKRALLISDDGEKYSPEEIEDAIVNCSEFILQCFLYNDHCKYTSALITLDEDKVIEYVSNNNITSPEKLLEVIKKSFYNFQNDDTYKNMFQKQWIPNVFAILQEPFSVRNEMLNSTFKIVRFKILSTYKDRIEQMYSIEHQKGKQENLRILAKIMEKKF